MFKNENSIENKGEREVAVFIFSIYLFISLFK